MSVESFHLFSVEREAVMPMLAAARRSHERDDWGLTAFSGFPTAMLFGPDERHAGSMHYMFFPAQAKQRFHHHPGSRCILLLGDVELHVHYSSASCDVSPEGTVQTLVVPALTFTALRFPAYLWHCFETRGRAGSGVLALTFHDDDQLTGSHASYDDLMENRTVYWSGVA